MLVLHVNGNDIAVDYVYLIGRLLFVSTIIGQVLDGFEILKILSVNSLQVDLALLAVLDLVADLGGEELMFDFLGWNLCIE